LYCVRTAAHARLVQLHSTDIIYYALSAGRWKTHNIIFRRLYTIQVNGYNIQQYSKTVDRRKGEHKSYNRYYCIVVVVVIISDPIASSVGRGCEGFSKTGSALHPARRTWCVPLCTVCNIITYTLFYYCDRPARAR